MLTPPQPTRNTAEHSERPPPLYRDGGRNRHASEQTEPKLSAWLHFTTSRLSEKK